MQTIHSVNKTCIPLFSVVLLFCVFALAPFTYGQPVIPTVASSLTFTLNPEHPEPNERVRIEVESFSVDLKNSYIEWYQSGTRIGAGIGMTSVDTAVGALGETHVISVIIETPAGTRIRDELVLRPVDIALLWEADTYTPPFFRGRALPTQGASIRAEAIPNFVRPDGTRVANENLVFTWKRNGEVLPSISGRAQNAVRIDAPAFFGEHIISVDVVSTDDTFNGSALVRIPDNDPYLTLYRDDPLLGIMFSEAIPRNGSLADTETTLAAIPYYTSIKFPSDPSLSYQWEIGNTPVEEDPSDPFRIVLQATEGLTNAMPIALTVSHNEHVLQTARREWLLSLSRNVTPQQDPFSRPVQ